jgi:hypothetical protein
MCSAPVQLVTSKGSDATLGGWIQRSTVPVSPAVEGQDRLLHQCCNVVTGAAQGYTTWVGIDTPQAEGQLAGSTTLLFAWMQQYPPNIEMLT